ncbi:hypothetical protein WME79_27285 [Sorangium sp. So ce726]|uniref:hypothetical protein n=1 Tax=Sorangium sp. So ce726 TaxID=3133319 RepID=UPI003F60C14A
MMYRSVLVLCPAMMTSLAACVGLQEGEDDDVGVLEQGVLVENALTSNALTSNALTSNALTSNALTSNALTSNALTSNALTSNALRDPLARELLKYVVSCALPRGAHLDVNIDGVVHGFDGELGLHKNWGDMGGSCDNACKTWVSACVLSRINHLGIATPISMRGNKSELSSDWAERMAYPRREGAYYGNIFANPPIYYACLSPEQNSIERVCGPSLDDCALTVVGTCRDACDIPQGDGSYPNCRDHVRNWCGSFPSGTIAYSSSVTIFLK